MSPRKELADGALLMRQLSTADRQDWFRLRQENAAWLAPWEASYPVQEPQATMTFGQYVRSMRKQFKRREAINFVLVWHGELAGQVTISPVYYGSARSAAIGYWIGERFAGQGIMPTSVALAIDYCFTDLELHRVEINIRPENAASLRVVEKLGLRYEGRRHQYLHIAGQWADHESFAIVASEAPSGLLNRYKGDNTR